MNKSESIKNISEALGKFQQEVKQPIKDSDNPFFKSKYVPLNSVIATVKEAASKCGLSYSQAPVSGNMGLGVQTLIMHVSGEWIEHEPFYLPLEKQTAQSGGSCITYSRRYSLAAAFGIDCDVDDDGNATSGQQNKFTQSSTPSPVTPTKPLEAPAPITSTENAQPTDWMTEIQFKATKERMVAAKAGTTTEDASEILGKAVKALKMKKTYREELEAIVK